MSKVKIVLLFILGLLIVFNLSCAQDILTKPSPESKSSIKEPAFNPSQTQAKDSWEVEWDRIVKSGKKENKVVLHSTGGAELRNKVASAFKQKYNIDLEVITGSGSELAGKLNTERRAGLYQIDLSILGITTLITQLKPAGILERLEPALILPEVINPKVWYGGDLRWADKDHTVLVFIAAVSTDIAINTNIVKPDDIKSFRDLLNPRWKGKIVMTDPTVAGAGLSTFSFVGEVVMGWDFWRDIVKQEPLVTRDQRLQTEWVAQGKYYIAISPKTALITEFKEAGAPLSYLVPVEGAQIQYGSGTMALINRAPHPNATRVFINWLLTKEGQTIYSQALGSPSARIDVSTDGLDPDKIIRPGMKIFLGNATEEWAIKDSDRIRLAKDIFTPLIK